MGLFVTQAAAARQVFPRAFYAKLAAQAQKREREYAKRKREREKARMVQEKEREYVKKKRERKNGSRERESEYLFLLDIFNLCIRLKYKFNQMFDVN